MDGLLLNLFTNTSFLSSSNFREVLSVDDYLALSSTCHSLRRPIFRQEFWKVLVTAAFPDERWALIADINYYAVLLSVGSANINKKNVGREFKRRFVEFRLAQPVSSKMHLGFSIRLDTPPMPPVMLVIKERIPDKEKPKTYLYGGVASDHFEARIQGLSFRSRNPSKLREEYMKKKGSAGKNDDPFFRTDRRVNNNGLLGEEEEVEQAPAQPAPVRREPPPERVCFTFARPNDSTYHRWSGAFNRLDTRHVLTMLDRCAPPAQTLRVVEKGNWWRLEEKQLLPSRADEEHFERVAFNARELQGCRDVFRQGYSVDVCQNIKLAIPYKTIYAMTGLKSEKKKIRVESEEEDSE